MVDGPRVAVDLLQGGVAAGVPEADRPVFTARHQQGARWIQTNGVHLQGDTRACFECSAATFQRLDFDPQHVSVPLYERHR